MTLPTVKFAAPVVKAAIASLQANLPAQITAYNAEAGNTFDLDVPGTYHFGGTDLLSAFPFPQIEVAMIAGSTGNWAVSRVETDHDPVVNVAIWVQIDSGEVPELLERAYGYGRVVLEVLSQPGAFGPEVEVGQDNGAYWRVDMIPPDASQSGPRSFERWTAPFMWQFRLEEVLRFVP